MKTFSDIAVGKEFTVGDTKARYLKINDKHAANITGEFDPTDFNYRAFDPNHPVVPIELANEGDQ